MGNLLHKFWRGTGPKSGGSETRAVQPGYTAALMAAREAWISGGSGLAELTRAVQASVSLCEPL